ncbi:hypothetical protein ACSNOK_02005 [Streptomyces sp. URMC 126]|uniref:hypothetical protein n=1 Tax=Streptomyces sp. URMC 126 TaxID=3423401 RepID=UPI003F1A9272
MKRGSRRAGLVAGVMAVLASAVAPAVAGGTGAGTGTGSAGVAGAGVAGCPTVSGHRVDCGTVDRPLVAGKPGLGTIKVRYAVVRHRAAGAAKGTVAINPGGPGETAIDRAEKFAHGLRDLLADPDLLLVDPRAPGCPARCRAGSATPSTGSAPGNSSRNSSPAAPGTSTAMCHRCCGG